MIQNFLQQGVVKEFLLCEHQEEAVNTEFILNGALNMSLEKKGGILIFRAVWNCTAIHG